jgi:ribosomal protein S27AE
MTEYKRFKCTKCGEENPRKLQEVPDKTQVLYYSMQGTPVYKKHIKCGNCGNTFEKS